MLTILEELWCKVFVLLSHFLVRRCDHFFELTTLGMLLCELTMRLTNFRRHKYLLYFSPDLFDGALMRDDLSLDHFC